MLVRYAEGFCCAVWSKRIRLLILPVSCGDSGPNGREFDFRLTNRNDSAQLEQLAAALLQIRSSVPHGIVCFFASYSYMDAVLAKLDAAGHLDELRSRTAVFHEPRHAKDLEKLLARYAEQVGRSALKSCCWLVGLTAFSVGLLGQAVSDRGAIIFCVVGGKLSEGINFSDDLARAVVVVGLPYPDMRDIELQQRMQQLDRRRVRCLVADCHARQSLGVVDNFA